MFTSDSIARLQQIQKSIAECRACPRMVGPPVHGPAVLTPIFLLGQAPGPHEGKIGKPFAYTAGRTLFRWFEESTGVDEERFRAHVYMAAVARCFPGKGSGGGDRVPDPPEIQRCSTHLTHELAVLRPTLLLAVGKLAISEALGPVRFGKGLLLTEVVGRSFDVDYRGHRTEVICLPHPSGLSSWPKIEPGRSLLAEALRRIAEHPVWKAVFQLRSTEGGS